MSITKIYSRYTNRKKRTTRTRKNRSRRTRRTRTTRISIRTNSIKEKSTKYYKKNVKNYNTKTHKNKKIKYMKGGAGQGGISVQDIIAYWKKKHENDPEVQIFWPSDVVSTENRGHRNYKPGKLGFEVMSSQSGHHQQQEQITNDMPTEIVADYKPLSKLHTPNAPKQTKIKY